MQEVFEAAARLQELVPDAVLVEGTAAAHHAGHRVSLDDDHVVADPRRRFDEILADLEATQGWITARVRRPERYRKLDRRWQNWQTVADWCRRIAVGVLDRLAEPPQGTP